MKYLKKKQKNKYTGLIVTVVILLGVALGMVVFLMTDRTAEPQPTVPAVTATVETTAATEVTEAVEESIEPTKSVEIVELVNGEIQTPYCTLHYPDALADHLIIAQVGNEPYTLEFYAAMEGKAEIRLFDISLGEGSGGNIGLVKTPAGEIPLNVTIYSLSFDESWEEGEIVTAYAMQDVVNEMIEEMSPQKTQDAQDASVIAEQPVKSDTINYIEIITPYCTMYYPAQWKSMLRLEHVEEEDGIYKVHFYGQIEDQEVQLLFSIYFGGDEGEQLGAVMGSDGIPVPVNILLAELNPEGWAEENAKILYSMQEAANQLIAKLDLIH